MDEMKDPITLDFTATQAPAEDAPVGQKALDSERPPVRVVLLALDQGKFDSQRSLDELAALGGSQRHAGRCYRVPEAAAPPKPPPFWGGQSGGSAPGMPEYRCRGRHL